MTIGVLGPRLSLALRPCAQFVFDYTRLSSGDIQLVTVITNAACIRYQLLGVPAG